LKILINTASTHKGGSVQVAYSFINDLKNFGNNEYHIILGKSLQKMVNVIEFPVNFYFYNLDFRPGKNIFTIFKANHLLSKIENEIKPNIVFTTSGPSYWKPISPHLLGFNLAHYVYQESPFFNIISIGQTIRWRIKGFLIRFFFKRDASIYFTQTDDIKERLKKWLNTKNVYTISNTCNPVFFSHNICSKKLPIKESNEFRLLLLSAYYNHKYFEVIPKIIEIAKSEKINNFKFVLTLPDEDYQNIISEEISHMVFNVGPMNIEECPSLYNECDALFLPTLLECFSASYVEAMAMNKPIITSDLGFARTICDNAALYFNPMDPRDVFNKIQILINNEMIYKELIENGKKRLAEFPNSLQRTEQFLELCLRFNRKG
jgi:glycosyltransferase involved in cell wall biosynthesis